MWMWHVHGCVIPKSENLDTLHEQSSIIAKFTTHTICHYKNIKYFLVTL